MACHMEINKVRLVIHYLKRYESTLETFDPDKPNLSDFIKSLQDEVDAEVRFLASA